MAERRAFCSVTVHVYNDDARMHVVPPNQRMINGSLPVSVVRGTVAIP